MRPIVIMGVAGSGKTTLGLALAEALGRPFVDADDLHTDAARAKMAAGVALTDEDRWPWLDRTSTRLAAGDGVVIACSALKSAYRQRLRQDGVFHLVYLAITPEEAAARLAARAGHFFAASLLASQFVTLEPPVPEERALTLPAGLAPADAAARAADWISRQDA